MGIPAANGIDAVGLPNAGDQANAVVMGSFTAIGPGDAFAFRGPLNLEIWASYTTALTTTAGTLAATTAGSGAVAPGASVNSKNVPLGATWATFAAGAGNLALPAYAYFATSVLANGQVTLPPGSDVD